MPPVRVEALFWMVNVFVWPPDKTTAFAIVLLEPRLKVALTPSLLPSPSVMAPVPKALELFAVAVPERMFVPPVKVLALLRLSVPVPFIVTAPLVLITPNTLVVPPVLKVMAPVPVFKLPRLDMPPLVIKFSAPPAVVMVLAVFFMVMPPLPAEKVTLLPTVCARFRLPLARLLMVIL